MKTRLEIINEVTKLLNEDKIMFWNKKDTAVQKPTPTEEENLREEIKHLNSTIRDLKKEKQRLSETIEEAKFKKRLEQEEIIHLNKLEKERMKQELENEKASINKKYAEDIGAFKEEQRKQLLESLTAFHSKIESRFNDELKNLKEVYGLLMEKLPNVNFAITKEISDRPTSPVAGAIEVTGKGRDKR